MSDKIVELVRQQSNATRTAKFVLLIYAFYAHDDGSGACPSVGRVAEEIGITPSAVYQHLKELEALGEIRYDGKSPIYRTPSYTVLPQISQIALPASQFVKQALIESVCLSVPESSPNGVKENNRQTDYSEASLKDCEAGLKDDEPADVQSLVNDLAEYAVTGSHIVGWVRLIVQRSNWQAEVANILAYWEANDNLGERWIAARLKQLAYLSHNTPYRSLRVVRGRDAPEDEFEAIRRAYGGYLQAQSGGEYANVS